MKIDDRMKLYERQYDASLLDRLPLIVRIDGKAFHSYTKKAMKPFDAVLHGMMRDTVKGIVEEFGAKIGYTQSDEMSFLFYQDGNDSQLPFGGRVNKINSCFASVATSLFMEARYAYGSNIMLPFRANFDCRCFVTPTKQEAINYFLWREQDATKNAISMAAHWKLGHSMLQGKNGGEMQELLFKLAGINFNNYPTAFKRGSWVRRETYSNKAKDICDISSLPQEHNFRKNPDMVVTRSETRVLEEVPVFATIVNKEEFLFNGASPVKHG